MKTGLLILLIFTGQLLPAQPVSRVYGYSQGYIPGNIPARQMNDEEGKTVKRSFVTVKYLLYMTINGAAIVQPKQVWIKGQPFKIKTSWFVKTPVQGDKDGEKILVPLTASRTIQMEKGDTLKTTISTRMKKMTKDNELVIVYTSKGITYYATLKKLKELDPVLAQ